MSQEIILGGVEAEGSWAHQPALAPHVAGEAGRTYQSFSEKAESWLWCTIACKDAEEGGKGQLQTPLSLLCRDLLLTFLPKTVFKAGGKNGMQEQPFSQATASPLIFPHIICNATLLSVYCFTTYFSSYYLQYHPSESQLSLALG